ncbi:MAG: hypothetical protein GTO14_13015 [Anaerolineales bacterium]|nr:hypothetical protein [Anaerolineales bacterium]
MRVHANRFAFSPATLRVEVGERITMELTSEDVVHGLFIDEYGIQLQADPGQVASATFVADRPGTFRMRCSVTCGPLHPFMLGRLEVGETARPLRAVVASLLALAAGLIPTSRRLRRES